MDSYFRIVKIPNLLFYLPIYFFALTVSPNFTEDSLGKSLILTLIATISFRGIQEFFTLLRKHNKLFTADIILFILILSILIGTGVFLYSDYVITILVLTIILSFFAFSLPDSNPFELSLALFVLSYLTINKFDFSQFFQFEIVLASLISIPMMFLFYQISGVRKGFVLPFMALSVFLLITEQGNFIWILALAFIPKFIAMLSKKFFIKTLKITDYLIAFTIVGYFLYYMLYGAHLIQVLGF